MRFNYNRNIGNGTVIAIDDTQQIMKFKNVIWSVISDGEKESLILRGEEQK